MRKSPAKYWGPSPPPSPSNYAPDIVKFYEYIDMDKLWLDFPLMPQLVISTLLMPKPTSTTTH